MLTLLKVQQGSKLNCLHAHVNKQFAGSFFRFDDCHRHDLQVGFSATDKIFLQEMSLCSLKREKREILLPLLLFVVTGIDI